MVLLNAQRSADTEQHESTIRWLRFEFQATGELAVQVGFTGIVPVPPAAPSRPKQPCPATLPDQAQQIASVFHACMPHENL